MHELSLALEVERLARAALPPDAAKVLAVGVEVGDDAGIEPENFRFCLDALLAGPPFFGARAELIPCAGPRLRLAWVEVDDGRPDD